jgi:hypothetical protein
VYEIDPGTNENVFPTVLYPFKTQSILIMPIPETAGDHGLWKTDMSAPF